MAKSHYFNKGLIDRIVNEADIVGYISNNNIELKHAGGEYQAPCPFHSETKPSFKVNPKLNIWKCFGCGMGGNIISFAMQYKKLSFVDAVKDIAEFSSIEIPKTEAQRTYIERIGSLYDLCQEVSSFFHNRLKEPRTEIAHKALKLLEKRGIDSNFIDKFELGVAEDNYDYGQKILTEYFKKRYPPDEILDKLVDIGVLTKKGKYKNPSFRQRLIFPIKDQSNNVIAFSGRLIPSVDYGNFDPPKYFNSRDTILFKKGKTLSGLTDLKNLHNLSKIFIVEGPFDYFAFKKIGIDNCVFTNGTALTEKHLNILSRYTGELVFCYDSDKAGRESTIRGATLALKKYFKVSAVDMFQIDKAKLDPEEFINKHGSDKFLELVEMLKEIFDFLLDTNIDFGFDNCNSGVLPKLNEIIFPFIYSSPLILQPPYIKKLSKKLDVSNGTLDKLYGDYLEQHHNYFNRGRFSVEEKLLSFIASSHHHREIVGNEFDINDFSGNVHKTLFEYLTLKNITTPASTHSTYRFSPEQNLFSELESKSLLDDFKKYCDNKNLILTTNEIVQLSNVILDANPANEIILDLFRYQKLEQELSNAEEAAKMGLIDLPETESFLKFYDQTYNNLKNCKTQIEEKIQPLKRKKLALPLEELITKYHD